MEEINIIQKLSHESFVRYYAFQKSANWFKKSGEQVQVAYIVQELVEGGELFSYIAEEGNLSQSICRYYFRKLLKSLHYLHSMGFAHRDLKP